MRKTTIAFDPGAHLQLELGRTVPDDGREHFVEAILDRLEDGRFELRLLDDESVVIGRVGLRSDFLSALVTAANRHAAAA